MKRSRNVSLTVVAAITMAGCHKNAPDPCDTQSWDGPTCESAVRDHGYYSHGRWVPHMYGFPYAYYYGNYGSFVRSGGISHPAGSGVYAHPSGSVTRGGFGSSGSSHGSSSSGHSGGGE